MIVLFLYMVTGFGFYTSQYSLILGYFLSLDISFLLLFINFLLKLIKVIKALNLHALNLTQISLSHRIKIVRIVFVLGRGNDRINLEFFLFHFLMMASALIGISCFNEPSHRVKDVVKSSLGSDQKSFLKVFKKQNIFQFFLLTPIAISLVQA
jgi:hypothetical protein